MAMVTPLEQAWLFLKAMPPFIPRRIDEQVGMGRFRATYRDPVGKPGHVTKFGTGGGLADAMILREVAEMYPHLFIPEEIHPLPWKERSMQPDWLMTSKKDPEDYLMTMGERAVHPLSLIHI